MTSSRHPNDPSVVAEPYAYYAQLAAAGPDVVRQGPNRVFLHRHRHVAAALRHPHLGRDPRPATPGGTIDPAWYPADLPKWCRYARGSFMELDPPAHTAVRSIVGPRFSRAGMARLEDFVERTADRLVGAVADAGQGDLATAVAAPLPIAVTGRLLDLPGDELPQLVEWSHSIVAPFDPASTNAARESAESAIGAFVEYLRPIVATRAARPGDDVVSDLASAWASGSIGEDDVYATAILLFTAGHEATVHALGNAMAGLATGGTFGQVRAQPTSIPSAVEELLRYDTPLLQFDRWAARPADLAGLPVAAGTRITMLLGAANHDPEVFSEPGRIRVDRTPNPHMSFGGGVHRCLGSHLARIEMRAVLTALVRHLPHLEIASHRRAAGAVFRGFESLRWER